MRSALLFAVFVTWSLWLGSTIAVFVFGQYFHVTLPPATFHESVHAMFQVFGRYELILAAIGLLLAGALLVSYPTKYFVFLVAVLVLAGGMTVTVALGLMPAMEALRNQGRTDSPEFIRLHIKSMIALALQAGVLLLNGWIIFRAIQEPVQSTDLSKLNQTVSLA